MHMLAALIGKEMKYCADNWAVNQYYLMNRVVNEVSFVFFFVVCKEVYREVDHYVIFTNRTAHMYCRHAKENKI